MPPTSCMDSETEEDRRLVLDKAITPRPPKTTPYIYLVAILSAVGGFLFGYDTGVVSGAMIFIRDDFVLDDKWQELIVSITIAAAWIFALVAGYTTDRFGRKLVIIAASLIFTIGAAVMAFAPTKEILLVGRLVVGCAIGLASMAVPMYIAEVAPEKNRGSLVTLNSCFITGGQFVASLVCGGLSETEDGWRWMLGIAGVPSAIQFIGFLFMPESPRWLTRRGRYQEAMDVLQKMRGEDADVEDEFDAIKDNCLNSEREVAERGGTSVLEQIYQNSGLRRALLVGCMLQMIQQLTGINTVMYYSATIIEMSGVRQKSTAVWLAAATAGTNFVFTFVGFFLVERLGRRKLTLGSLLGVIASLCLIGAGFQLAAIHAPPVDRPSSTGTFCDDYSDCFHCSLSTSCGFCFQEPPAGSNLLAVNGTCLPVNQSQHEHSEVGLCLDGSSKSKGIVWAYEWCPSSYSYMTLLGLILYLVFFAPGMGPMPWTINSEIYPLWARSTCCSISTGVNWLFNLLVSLTFLTLTQAITKFGAFYLYAGFGLIGWIFFTIMLPETKGKSLEELETLFSPDETLRYLSMPQQRKKVQYVHIRGSNRGASHSGSINSQTRLEEETVSTD